MKRQNRIKNIIKAKFKLKPLPTRDLLEYLDMTTYRFNQILENRNSVEMTVVESKKFADWLMVDEEELWKDYEEHEKKTIADRYGLAI